MSQFTVYKNTDPGAPVLNANTGSLITILNSCLVSGYGNKAAAGWRLAFQGGTGVNPIGIAVYQITGAGAAQLYVRVNDNKIISALDATVFGYETMTDLNTGTNPFPSAAAISTDGGYAKKSSTNDTTTRNWVVYADDRTFYFLSDAASTKGYWGLGFGEYYSLVQNNSYRCMVITDNVAGASAVAANIGFSIVSNTSQAATAGFYLCRNYTLIGSSLQVNKHSNSSQTSSNVSNGIIPYPNPADGSFWLCPNWIAEPTTHVIIGRLRGLWNWMHPVSASINDGDTLVGQGELAGKTFQVVKTGPAATEIFVFETSNTLETN